MGSLCDKLPDELLEEILVELPEPSILNFKRVSKSWYNLFSSHCFLYLHSLTPHSASQPFVLFHPFFHKKSPIFTISLKHHEHIMQLSELPHSSSWMPRKIKCSNGILCILINKDAFCIVNPATGQSTRLPHIHGPPIVHFEFYFDPQNCKFKVLAVLFIEIHVVFDSTIGKWVEPIEALIFSLREIKSIGHTCYIYDRVNTLDLIAFDMVKEELHIIPAPPQRECNDHVGVMEWDGCISMAVVSHNLELRLWALRKEKTWEKVVDANLGEWGLKSRYEHGYIYPKVVVGNDILIVYGNKIVSYGIESGRLNVLLPSEEGLCHGDYLSYKPTLLSFDYDDGKKVKGGKKKSSLVQSCLKCKEKKASFIT
ncbi:hypothetical protein AMTRI_Chr10g224750 [Amborella trichopoda]